MSTEIEIYRITPTEGEHYYAILASRSYYDTSSSGYKGGHRYFAELREKRYMGQYIGCGRSGSGDGREYWEIYLKDGKHYELHYDYYGMTCLEKTDPLGPEELAVEVSKPPVAIDANIRLKKN
jgi:hypothetical protein